MALLHNPNPLNSNATPYVKLTPHFPTPLPLVLSYSPHYVYHYHYPVEMLYYKQPFFPRDDVVEKDVGAEEKGTVKKRNGRNFYAPRLGLGGSLILRSKLAKQKSRVAKKGLEKKEMSDPVIFTRENIVTTLMIRNIPNKFQRNDLLKILDNYCLEQNKAGKLQCDLWKSKYDFLYLPMDFKTGANLGYAFVNFTSPIAASRFRNAFQQYKWEHPNNKKICEISNAVIQGRVGLRNHFRNSVFPCHTNDYLPVVFSPPRHGSNSPRFDIVGRRVDISSVLTK